MCQTELLQKWKVHQLLHLVDCMKGLRPTAGFSTERYDMYKLINCVLHSLCMLCTRFAVHSLCDITGDLNSNFIVAFNGE